MTRFGSRIDAQRYFSSERVRLVTVLSGLSSRQWQAATVCPGWSVFDIATHVLGDDLGRLARSRDHHDVAGPDAGESLANFLGRFNEEWVVAARRLSPRLVTSSLEWTGRQIEELWAGQDLDALGEAVSWAGPGPAPVWLDAARDLSEYWIHRQQIGRAANVTVPEPEDLVHTVVDTLARGLPHALRACRRPPGTRVVVHLDGRGGGRWAVTCVDDGWEWDDRASASAAAEVVLDVESAWQLWTRGIEPEQARPAARVSGDEALAEAVLQMVSIIR